MSHERITVHIGEEQFVTTRETLSEGMTEGSQYFRHLFHFENATRPVEDNMSERTLRLSEYYLDANPTIFSHLLEYLRDGVMPLLWTEEKGFDYVAYAKLEKMADFLVVERLRRWISAKRYLEAVEVVHRASRQALTCERYNGPATWKTRHNGNVTYTNVTHTVSPETNCEYRHHRDGDITIITKEVVIHDKILLDQN